MKEKVYFAAGGGRIKVGTTVRAVSDRVTAINAHLSEPLMVIGIIDGGLPMERAVQAHLNPWHLKGEWFRDCEEVRIIVHRLVKIGPDAIGYDGPMFDFERAVPIPKKQLDRPSDPHMIGRMADLIWGDRVIEEFCASSQASASRTPVRRSPSMPRSSGEGRQG